METKCLWPQDMVKSELRWERMRWRWGVLEPGGEGRQEWMKFVAVVWRVVYIVELAIV